MNKILVLPLLAIMGIGLGVAWNNASHSQAVTTAQTQTVTITQTQTIIIMQTQTVNNTITTTTSEHLYQCFLQPFNKTDFPASGGIWFYTNTTTINLWTWIVNGTEVMQVRCF